MSQHPFGKRLRLRKRREFEAVYQQGRRYVGPHFRVFLLANTGEVGRLGIGVSRKVAKAAVRNRMKRLIREYFRTNPQQFAGWDVVVEVKPQGAALLDQFEHVLAQHVEKAFLTK